MGLVPKESEMAPGHLFGVMDPAIGSTASRTGEATGGIEVAAGDRPAWHKTQRQLQ
jgi:hypothetical protein